MTATANPTRAPRWQRMLLPGELRDGVDGRRSARDWVVDLALYGVAAGLGALVLVATWADHRGTRDRRRSSRSAWSRSWRCGAGAAPGRGGGHRRVASLVSGMAGGPALIALFNVAMRGSRRAIVAIATVALASHRDLPAALPGRRALQHEIALGVLITGS